MTITSETIRIKRVAAGITGYVLCRKAAIARSRLSDIERGNVNASSECLVRIDAALDDLIHAKNLIHDTAVAAGWPVHPAPIVPAGLLMSAEREACA